MKSRNVGAIDRVTRLRLNALMRDLSLIIVGLLVACSGAANAPPPAPPAPPASTPATVQSDDILAREPDANEAQVQHILIGWRDLAAGYGGQMDPRAEERSAEEAEALVATLVERIAAGEPFEALMGEYSEDRGSAGGARISVTPDASLVLDFKRLSLRLRPGEVGVVQTPFGWHIIKRVE